MSVHGHVTSVAEEIHGDELTTAHASGATLLQVLDTADFAEEGGMVRVNGVLYSYSAITDYPATLTLTTGLTSAAAEQDRVDVWDQQTGSLVVDFTADVVDDVTGDVLQPKVNHGLIDKLSDGLRGLIGESVTLTEDDDEVWWVTQIHGKTPTIDGTFIDPTTIPDPTLPTAPPAASPTLTVSGLSEAIVLRATPVEPSTLIRYQVAPDVDGNPGTWVDLPGAPSRSLVYIATSGPDGLALNPDATYHFRTQASNGVAPDPAPSASTAGAIDLSAITAVVAAEIVAGFILTGRIQIGAAYIDATEGMVVPHPNGRVTRIPFDGVTPATISAFLIAIGLSVEGNANFFGLVQVFSTMRFANGVTDPTEAPTLSATWTSILGVSGDFGDVWHGLTDNPTGDAWATVSNFFGTELRLFSKADSAFVANYSISGDFAAEGGITRIGSTYYVLGSDAARAGKWYVYLVNATTGAKSGEFFVANSFDKFPALGRTDGGELVMAWCQAGVMKIRRFNTDGTIASNVTLSHDGGTYDLGGVYFGAADIGGDRYLVAARGTVTKVFSFFTGGARNTATEFRRAAGATLRGLHFDGTRFRSLDGTGKVWSYAVGSAQDSTLYAAKTDYDGNSAGTGTHETRPSPRTAAYTRPARSFVVIDAPPPAEANITDPTKTDKADRVGLYIATTLAGTLRLQAYPAVGARSAVLDTIATATAAAPTTNGFIGVPGGLGVMAATSGGFTVDGASNGSIGTGTFRTSVDARVDAVRGMRAAGTTAIVTNASSTATVAFGKTFPVAPSVNANASVGGRGCTVTAVTTTGFTVQVWHWSTGLAASANETIRWSAEEAT